MHDLCNESGQSVYDTKDCCAVAQWQKDGFFVIQFSFWTN